MIEGEAEVLQADEARFHQQILEEKAPVLVGVYASWCSPCRALDPQLERLARDLGGRLRVIRLDADRCKAFVERFAIKGLPTSLLIMGGRECLRIAGVHPYRVFRRQVEDSLP